MGTPEEDRLAREAAQKKAAEEAARKKAAEEATARKAAEEKEAKEKAGQNKKAQNNEGSPFNLRTAATHGHLDLVELLLDERNPPFDDADDRGRTPLILAAAGGHHEVVEMLLEFDEPDPLYPNDKSKRRYVNVNNRAEDGSTALKAALTADSAEVAEVLLRKAGIDVGVGVKYGEEWTPLGAASLAGYLKVVKAIVKNLHALKSEEGTAALYEKHVGESIQGSPLYLASEGGHTKVVKFLLKDENLPPKEDKRQEYIDRPSMGGRTALLVAATNGHADVVDLLLQSGAKTTGIQSSDGMTPIKAAIIGGHTNVVKLLFAHNNASKDR